jgi:hypothetical protein
MKMLRILNESAEVRIGYLMMRASVEKYLEGFVTTMCYETDGCNGHFPCFILEEETQRFGSCLCLRHQVKA